MVPRSDDGFIVPALGVYVRKDIHERTKILESPTINDNKKVQKVQKKRTMDGPNGGRHENWKGVESPINA